MLLKIIVNLYLFCEDNAFYIKEVIIREKSDVKQDERLVQSKISVGIIPCSRIPRLYSILIICLYLINVFLCPLSRKGPNARHRVCNSNKALLVSCHVA